jgi:hypothetical protein
MLKVGESYTIKMWEDDENCGMITEHHGCKVVEVEGTLVKIRLVEKEQILNSASIAFVSAVRE